MQKKMNGVKKVTVTFNYRYSPHRAKMWELLRAGAVGKITSVDFSLVLRHSSWCRLFQEMAPLKRIWRQPLGT